MSAREEGHAGRPRGEGKTNAAARPLEILEHLLEHAGLVGGEGREGGGEEREGRGRAEGGREK